MINFIWNEIHRGKIRKGIYRVVKAGRFSLLRKHMKKSIQISNLAKESVTKIHRRLGAAMKQLGYI
jgi:predicted transcriptional regulator